MTLPQRSLFPTSDDDCRALLGAGELVAGCGLQLGQIVRAVVGQRMPLEPGPQIFHRIQIGRVRRQEGELNVSVECVQVVANEAAVVGAGAIPDDQQRLLQVILERLEELDQFNDFVLGLLDAGLAGLDLLLRVLDAGPRVGGAKFSSATGGV
mgnify:CR=1 FL=1